MLDTAAARQDTAAAARRGSARSGAHATVRRILLIIALPFYHLLHTFYLLCTNYLLLTTCYSQLTMRCLLLAICYLRVTYY